MNRNHTRLFTGLCILVCTTITVAQSTIQRSQPDSLAPEQDTASAHNPPRQGNEFSMDTSGAITFSRGLEIKGKIEKPQVMIFLPKEKSFYKEIEFSHSYDHEIRKPLPFHGIDDP